MHPLCADELRRTEMASTAAVVRQYVFVSPETSINAGNNLSSKCHPWSHCGAKARRSPRKSSVQQASASCVFSKAQSSPGKPQCFSAVGGARSGCNEASTLFPQSSIGPIGTVSTPVFRSSFLFLTQGKIPLPPLHFFSTFTQWEPGYEVSASSPALFRYGIESLEVIALDTFHVNVKLCLQSACCMCTDLLHQVNYLAPSSLDSMRLINYRDAFRSLRKVDDGMGDRPHNPRYQSSSEAPRMGIRLAK